MIHAAKIVKIEKQKFVFKKKNNLSRLQMKKIPRVSQQEGFLIKKFKIFKMKKIKKK